MRQKKRHLYTNNTLTLVCCFQHTVNHRHFKKHDITNIQNNVKDGVCSSEGVQGNDKEGGMEEIQKKKFASK